MRSGRDKRVKQLSKLSTNSKFILDSNSSHSIDPKHIAEAIQQLMNALSEGRKLSQ